MKNLRRKLMLTSLALCGSVAFGFGLLTDQTAEVSAIAVDGFAVKSASLRVPEGEYGQGIRYTITVNAETIEDGATTGVLMIPTSSLGNEELSLGLVNTDLRNYTLTWKDLGDTKEAYVHLYDVPAEQYATSISMCAYIQNPDAEPIYTTVKETSFAEVAIWAIENDETLSDTDKANLKSSYLTYEVNYYDDDETLLKEMTGVYNEKLSVYTPEKEGYEFLGWYNKAGTHEWDFDTMTVGATTTNLYAKWIVDLSAESTGEWNIGETTFTGPAVIRNSDNKPYNKLYPIGDNAVMMRIWNHSYAGFEASFKTPIDATSEDKYVSFTAKGANASLFTVVEFDTNGTAKTGATAACVTRTEANGYTTYVFRVAKGLTIGKFRVTPLGDTRTTGNGSEVIISNCTVGDYSSLRTGEDANTLFFYDTPLAVALGNMYYKANNNHQTVAYTTEKAYGDERGSTTVGGIQYGKNSYCLYKTSGAALSSADQAFLQEGDYLVFNVYSTAERKMYFSIMASGTTYPTTGHKLMPNTWTKIVVPASMLAATSSYYFLVNDVLGGTATGTSYDLYFSKIVRCSAGEVTNLSGNATTDTWSVGSTEFVGAPSVSNSAAGSGVLSASEYKKPYLVNGELILTFTRHNDPYISLKLAKSIEVAANTEMYMTVTVFNYGRLNKWDGYFLGSATNHLTYVSHTDIGGGYAKVVLKCDAKSSAYTINNVRIDLESHSDTSMATQLVIKDIVVSK